MARMTPRLPLQFCSCRSAGRRAGEHHAGLLQNPFFFSRTGEEHRYVGPQQAFPHLWPQKQKAAVTKREELRVEALTQLKKWSCGNRGQQESCGGATSAAHRATGHRPHRLQRLRPAISRPAGFTQGAATTFKTKQKKFC